MARRARQAGMTLIELIIVLAIIGMMVTLGTMAVRHVRKTSLREDTNQVAAVLRAAQNMAQLSGLNHRVIFDLDRQTYRIEQCPGELKLRKQDKEEHPEPGAEGQQVELPPNLDIPPELLANIDPEQGEKLKAALGGTSLQAGAASGCQVPTLPNGDADGRGNERSMNTEDEIKVRRILVQHLEDPALDGLVTIHFFPLGNAEKAMVVIGDDDNNFYSVLVHPFTGRVDVKKGEIDPDEFMRRDGAGNKVEDDR